MHVKCAPLKQTMSVSPKQIHDRAQATAFEMEVDFCMEFPQSLFKEESTLWLVSVCFLFFMSEMKICQLEHWLPSCKRENKSHLKAGS